MTMTEILPALELQLHENEPNSIVLDTKNQLLYLGGGWYSSSIYIAKINLTTFTQVLPSLGDIVGDSYYWFSAVIDSNNDFLYFGSGSNHIAKIKTPEFTVEGILTLAPENNWLYSADIDLTRGFAYFVSMAQSNQNIRLTKVTLSTFTAHSVPIITLPSWGYPFANIDTTTNFLYIGIGTNPNSKILKINLTTLTVVDTLILDADERYIGSSVIDTKNGFVYYFTSVYNTISKIIKIRLSDFTRVDTLILSPTDLPWVQAAVIDVDAGFAYFATDNYPGRIIKIDLSTFTVAQRLIPTGSPSGLVSAAIDKSNQIIYFGTEDWTKGRVVKIFDDDISPPITTAITVKRPILGNTSKLGYTKKGAFINRPSKKGASFT